MKLSRRAQSIKPSATLAITAKAKALQSQGKDVVSLGAGEPDFDTPEHVKAAAQKAMEQGFTKYTASAGAPELRKAIAAKMARENGLTYGENDIVATNGGKQALYEFFQAVVDDGDEVVIPAPYWVSYPDMVLLAGGKPVFVECDPKSGFQLDPAALKKALTPRTVAVVLNSPSNPTGAVWSRSTLEGIAAAVRDHGCLLVTDDIYEHLIYTGEPFANVVNVDPSLKERTVVVNGLSKSFSMTGWRIGWACGPRDVIAAMSKIQDQVSSNVSSITQKAAIAALEGPIEPVVKMRDEFAKRRTFVEQRLAAIPGLTVPPVAGAFYAFPDASALCARAFEGKSLNGSSVALAELLLERFGVAVIPGAPFGAEGFLRLSFATSMGNLEKALDRVEACARQLS